MSRHKWLLGGGVLAGLVASAMLGNACWLKDADPLYCDESTFCDDGFVCDTYGGEEEPRGLANSCIARDQVAECGDCVDTEPICVVDFNTACRGCASDEECRQIPDRDICLTAGEREGACVQCRPGTDDDCTDPDRPSCRADGVCVACQDHAGCSGDPAGDICDRTGVCVATCTVDANGDDCGAPGGQGDPHPDGAHCDMNTGMCVQCTISAHCVGDDAGLACIDGQCRPCETHENCDTGICDQSAADPAEWICVGEGDITYVTADGQDGAMCGATRDEACATIAGNDGALSKGSAWIHVAASETPYMEPNSISLDNAAVHIVGEADGKGAIGVTLETAGTTVVQVTGNNSNVVIEGIALDAPDGGDGVSCSNADNQVQKALRLYRTRIRGTNDTRGVLLSNSTFQMERTHVSFHNVAVSAIASTIELRNNLLTDSSIGLNLVGTATTTLEFNTITNNSNFGINCENNTNFSEANNIIYNVGSIADLAVCIAGSSLVGEDPSLDANYHLTAQSTNAIDRIGPGGIDLTEDFDGDPRPINGNYDYGADEFQ